MKYNEDVEINLFKIVRKRKRSTLLTIWKVQAVMQVLSTVLSFIQDKSLQIIVSVFTIGTLVANIVFLVVSNCYYDLNVG